MREEHLSDSGARQVCLNFGRMVRPASGISRVSIVPAMRVMCRTYSSICRCPTHHGLAAGMASVRTPCRFDFKVGGLA